MVESKSKILKPYQKFLIILFSGTLTGLIVWLVLFILNPSSWKVFTNTSGFINVMVFVILGLTMSFIYYKNQFKKLESIGLKINEKIVLLNNDQTMTYTHDSLKHVSIDMQFYYLFNLRRLNLYFEEESEKKLKIISLLVTKDEAFKLKETLKKYHLTEK